MKKITVLSLFVVMIMLCANMVPAQDGSQSKTASAAYYASFGYVDIDQITSTALPVKDVIAKFEADLRVKQNNIDAKYDVFKQKKADYKQKSSVITEEEKNKKIDELKTMQKDIEDMEQVMQEDFKKKDQEILQPVLDLILKTIEQIAKEKRIDVVLRKENVLYADKGFDITGDVIARINAQYVKPKEYVKPNEDIMKKDIKLEGAQIK